MPEIQSQQGDLKVDMNAVLLIHSVLHNSLPSTSNHQKVFVVSDTVDDYIWLEEGLVMSYIHLKAFQMHIA